MLKEDGKTEYKYSVNEENVSGYDSNVVESEETDAAGDGGKVKVFTITNTKTETGSLKVSKTVEGNGQGSEAESNLLDNNLTQSRWKGQREVRALCSGH